MSIVQFPFLESIRMANRSPESLGDFVRRIRNKKGFSLTDVAKQSRRFGPSIAASYVSRIENDPTRKPTAVALKALAYGLGVPPEELLARAVGLFEPGGKSEELQLLSRFKELSPEKRDIVLDIVDMLYSKESRHTPKRKPA